MHANAFGSFLTKDQIDDVRKYFDEHFDAAAFDDTYYEVDYWFKNDERINKDMLKEIASNNNLWGNSIPQPKIAFSFTMLPSNITIMGKKEDSFRIKKDGVDFVGFGMKDFLKTIKERPQESFFDLDIVGRPEWNSWGEQLSLQIIIDDIQITPEEKYQEIDILSLI